MKYLISTLIIHTFSIICLLAQLTVDKGIYKVNYSNALHAPRYVSYYLYRGGGVCKRDNFKFFNDEPQLDCASDKDYSGNKTYDKGHLANAEDFAADCTKEELTFRYYNCFPQTVNLNRGIWKQNEADVRKWSQKEQLYIICGGYYGNKKLGQIAVPDYCWKVVQSVKSKKVLFCGWFSNTAVAKLDTIPVQELEKRLNSKIILLQ
jgi:DNA/RNA endonuclease G, NUC1